MPSVQASPVESGSSPRSAVLVASDRIAKGVASMDGSKMASGSPSASEKVTSPSNSTKETADASSPDAINPASSSGSDRRDAGDELKSPTTTPEKGQQNRELSPTSEQHVHVSSPTHQNPGSAYNLAYANTPPSPNITSAAVSVLPYEASVFQQPGTFAAAQTSPFGVPSTNTPLSPPRSSANMVTITPASPLFPRMNSGGGLEGGQGSLVAPQSPSLSYVPGPLGSGSMSYPPSYAATARMGSQGASSSSEEGVWDRSHSYSSQGMMYSVMGRPARTFSLDSETMLPPSVLDTPDQSNPAYSPFSGSHSSPAGGNLFTHQQPWNYPGPLPDMYSAPGSPLQPRPQQMHMFPGGPGMRPMGNPYGHPHHHYYQASSPGPPIQTTASNKGPDGANLFIFHIPNHFTNVDMYNLFCPFGNLLSVRIMVEKDTGRSRGFGFVSYDNPESAALAIKELNGYAIGNKRLKVQHKQIRQRDLHDREGSQGGPYGQTSGSDAGSNFGRQSGSFSSSLPPSGAGQNLWYDPRAPDGQAPSTAVAAAVASTTEVMVNTDVAEEGAPELAAQSSESSGVSPPPKTSPLSNLGTLQGALPKVAGAATTAE